MEQVTIEIEYPFTSELSKNKRYGCYSNKFKNRLHVDDQNEIQFIFNARYKALGKIALKDRVYISLSVIRPSRRTDASNYINPINDAIFKCFTFGDNYCAGDYDFSVDKNNPRFVIKVTFWAD